MDDKNGNDLQENFIGGLFDMSKKNKNNNNNNNDGTYAPKNFRPAIKGSNINDMLKEPAMDRFQYMDRTQLEKEIKKLNVEKDIENTKLNILNQNKKNSDLVKTIQPIPQKSQPIGVLPLDKPLDINKPNYPLQCRFLNTSQCHPDFPNFVGASVKTNGQMQCNSPENEKTATATASISNGSINKIHILDGGSGYNQNNPPNANIVGGGGRNATLKCIVKNGKITDIIIVKNGEGFHETPDIKIDSPTLSQECYMCCK